MTTLVERTAAIAQQARASQPTREDNRIRWPDTAEWMDQVRAHWGQPCWFRVTREDGVEVSWGEKPSWADRRGVQASPPPPKGGKQL